MDDMVMGGFPIIPTPTPQARYTWREDVTPDVKTDRYWLRLAYDQAIESRDPRTQNGAVLLDAQDNVIGTAYNRLPEGVTSTPERWEAPDKYEYVEHAERGAIYHAARYGHATLNGTLYAAWAACADCARGIIEAGIIRLVRHADATKMGRGGVWDGSISSADTMLHEAGVEVVDITGKLTLNMRLRHSGEWWSP